MCTFKRAGRVFDFPQGHDVSPRSARKHEKIQSCCDCELVHSVVYVCVFMYMKKTDKPCHNMTLICNLSLRYDSDGGRLAVAMHRPLDKVAVRDTGGFQKVKIYTSF